MEISLTHIFADLEDPRQAHKVEHDLQEVLILAIIAVLSNAQSWTQIEAFGEAKEVWLKQWLVLKNGIPSHDTIQRVFQLVPAEAIMARFSAWTQGVTAVTEGRFVAIDGKVLRASYDSEAGQKALHLIRAWATEQGLLLGQQRVDSKSNEITAIPEVLEMLMLKGCIVTIDAMGCQKEIAQAIHAQAADYVLALKENQKSLYRHAVDWFDYALSHEFQGIAQHDYAQTINKGHGRIEIRECWVISEHPLMTESRERESWAGLHSLVKIRRQCIIQGNRSEETAYYISSLVGDAALILQAVRRHWVLDIIFDEDRSRIRLGESPVMFKSIDEPFNRWF